MIEKETFQEDLREVVDELLESKDYTKIDELVTSLKENGHENIAGLLFEYACKESSTFKKRA